jgi:hypothetical protein
MTKLVTIFLVAPALLVALWIYLRPGPYGIGIQFPHTNHDVSIRMSNGISLPPQEHGGTLEAFPGPVPDWVEISWTDAAGARHT